MIITVFNSSPRTDKGNTHRMVEPFLEGTRDAGAEAEEIFLARKKILPCNGCYTCWTKTPGKCIHRDDMDELIPKAMASDLVIFATPLYVDNVSGIMKNFMDRLIPVADPHFEKDENGESRHFSRNEKIPKIGVISNCGFPEQSHFQVIEHLFKRIARNLNSQVVVEIYRGAGELLKLDSLVLKPILWNYFRKLKSAGKEVAKNGFLSDETRKELEKPLIPDEQYIKAANESWDKKLNSSSDS